MNKNKVLPKPLAFVFTAIVILLLPLLIAALFGGIDWISQGPEAGLKEFLVAYFLGLVVLLAQLGFVIYRGRKSKRNAAEQ